MQIPTWDRRLFDLARAADSQTYCDEVAGTAAAHGLALTELSTHLQGQLVAVNPAYDAAFDAFAPEAVRGDPLARQAWAVEQVTMAARASRRLGLAASVSFTGGLAWPFVYPWPQRPAGLVETSFTELARRWRPILDSYDENGCDLCFELHPGEDVFDGDTFEQFLDAAGGHRRLAINYDPSHFLLQGLDYLAFIDIYHERIRAFHAKDAEFNPTGRQGFYSGLRPWLDRAARFRSLGRRAGGLRRDLLQARPTRLRLLGGARMGVLPETPGGRRARGRGLHRRPHHPGDGARLRRLRRLRARRGAEPAHAGPRLIQSGSETEE